MYSSYLSRKSLLFLCLSVASVVFLMPSIASAYQESFSINYTQGDTCVSGQPTNSDVNGYLYNDLYHGDCFVSTTTSNSKDFISNPPTQAQGYNFYILSDDPDDFQSLTVDVISNLGDVVRVQHSISEFTTFTDSSGLGVVKYNGLPSLTQADYKIHFMQAIHGFPGAGAYALIYTDENLTTTITSRQEMYSYLEQEGGNQGIFETPESILMDYTTRFLDAVINDTNDEILDVTHYINPDEIDPSKSSLNPTQIKVEYADVTSNSLSSVAFNIGTPIGTSTTQLDLSLLNTGTYDLRISFSNIGCAIGLSACPFPDSYLLFRVDKTPQSLTITSGVENYNNVQQEGALGEIQDCGLTNISGCIVNAFAYLFVPSQSSIDNFISLNDELAVKFPFAYVYDFQSSVTGLYTTATTESLEITVPFGSFGDITLLSAGLIQAVPFSLTIRTILGYLLWIMFAVQMYRRTLKIFNTNPV